jgi:hypothetical protein
MIVPLAHMSASPAVELPKPVVASALEEYAGELTTELLSCPVMAVTPLEATEPVSAVAMSAKSLFTAADEMTVPGTKGACGSE